MWSDRVSNPGPLALESDVLPTALRLTTINMEANLLTLKISRVSENFALVNNYFYFFGYRLLLIIVYGFETSFNCWLSFTAVFQWCCLTP